MDFVKKRFGIDLRKPMASSYSKAQLRARERKAEGQGLPAKKPRGAAANAEAAADSDLISDTWRR